MDTKKIELATKMLLEAIGEDVSREGLKNTPRRVAKFWEKACAGYTQDEKDMVTFFDGENYDEMILCRNIEFHSLCEHHLLPILGKAHVAYIPKEKIIGLSKLPRIVEMFARRLQNQERLTSQIADTIEKLLQPKGVAVVISAKHLCVSSRGVEKQNAIMETSAVRGLFKKDPRTRAEFFEMIRG
ncbi:GTP cyclohydrolase I FolE [Candidatus Peregrinibacteria bacterium]|nr:GTP cyclohydrolase I FolE [Candidatus Peregrinibacteria bacterium]